MDIQQLASFVEQPRLHQQLLGGFDGSYTLGVGMDPDQPAKPALILHVAGDEAPHVPSQIELGGETVKVITRTGLKPIHPLGATL